MGKTSQGVVARVGSMGEMQIGMACRCAESGRHDLHVANAVAGQVALQIPSLARTRLDGHNATARADTLRSKQRVVTIVGANVDEHHAGLQQAIKKGELVGLE